MLPIVDPQVQLWTEHLAGGVEPYPLQTFLAQPHHVHVLRAIQVSPARDASRTHDEAAWIEKVATTPGSGGLPNALVAAIDLASPTVAATLTSLAGFARVRGFRPVNREGIAAASSQHNPHASARNDDIGDHLTALGLLLDLSVERQHLSAVADFARRYPSLSVVVSAAAPSFFPESPGERGGNEAVSLIAGCENVVLKLCGFGPSEAIRPSIDAIIDRMGIERVMFASGYPARRRLQDYDDIWQNHAVATMHRSAKERDALFRTNAMRIYSL